MVIVDDDHKEELEACLVDAGLHAYTEIPETFGMGITGPHLGSRAFPGTSAIIFSILEDDGLEAFRETVAQFKESRGVRVKVVAWEVEEVA